jgi:tryptophanyl-tRNA synthetase
MAGAFNRTYGEEVFVVPEYKLSEGASVPGIDGAKMSKSYGNTIPIFGEGKPLKKAVMSIKTDATPLEDPKDPDGCLVFQLYSLFASEAEKAEMAERYRAGGYGYGEAKKALLAKIEETFADGRQRKRELDADPDLVRDVLREGAKRARAVAREVTDRARRACGID